jgi:hypothetical protein
MMLLQLRPILLDGRPVSLASHSLRPGGDPTPAQSHRARGDAFLDSRTKGPAGTVGAFDECTTSPVNGSDGGGMQVGNVLVPSPAQQYLSPEQEQQQSQSGQQQGQSVSRSLFASSAERATSIDIDIAPAPAALTAVKTTVTTSAWRPQQTVTGALTTTTTTTVSAYNQSSNTNALVPGGGSWKQNGQTGEGKSTSPRHAVVFPSNC